MLDVACTCPSNDWERCIKGIVYGPCSDEHCGGVCEDHGNCPCPLHRTDHTHDACASTMLDEAQPIRY